LQVAALTKEADALEHPRRTLAKKKFRFRCISQADKYYRVQSPLR